MVLGYSTCIFRLAYSPLGIVWTLAVCVLIIFRVNFGKHLAGNLTIYQILLVPFIVILSMSVLDILLATLFTRRGFLQNPIFLCFWVITDGVVIVVFVYRSLTYGLR
jgi:hypothetical protein